jgi:hypothetical protein
VAEVADAVVVGMAAFTRGCRGRGRWDGEAEVLGGPVVAHHAAIRGFSGGELGFVLGCVGVIGVVWK